MPATLELRNCIRYWEVLLKSDRILMTPSVQVIIESTIAHLKKLESLEPRQLKLEG